MNDVTLCVSEISPVAALGSPSALDVARQAIDRLLAPHAASPLRAISTLYDLLDAFRDLKIGSRAGQSISDAIVDRILQIEQAMLTRQASPAIVKTEILLNDVAPEAAC